MIRLIIFVMLLPVVTSCATSSQVQRDNQGVGTEEIVPVYVQNLPKSRFGNMEQYTVFGKRYRVLETAENFSERGVASWYGKKFHGRKTSSGEIYDMYEFTAAHKHLPLPTFVRVTNLENGKQVIVKVNDRGPFIGRRVIDLSFAAAEAIGMAEQGTVDVAIEGLSTHHVAENKAPNPDVLNPDNVEADTLALAEPQVIEPEVTAVPIQPAVQVLDAIEPEPELPIEPETETASAPLSEPETLNTEVNQPVTLASVDKAPVDVDGTDDGFIELTEASANIFLQIGAFSSQPNAESLVQSVSNQTGLPAFIEQDNERQLYRVKMGPFVDGVMLDTTINELAVLGFETLSVKRNSQ